MRSPNELGFQISDSLGDFPVVSSFRPILAATVQTEQSKTRRDEARQTGTHNRAGHGRSHGGIDRTGIAIRRKYVGNEDVPKIIRNGQVSNGRIINGEDDVVGERASIPVRAAGAINPESEISCAIPAEGPG